MTRIDFYIIKQARTDVFVCRLSEKIYKSGFSLFINANDDQQCRQLDISLWTFRDQSFVPHAICKHGQQHKEKVLIGHSQAPQQEYQVLINLADQVPDYFSRSQRVAEIIANHETAKHAGRQRYNYYRERGYEIQTHQIN